MKSNSNGGATADLKQFNTKPRSNVRVGTTRTSRRLPHLSRNEMRSIVFILSSAVRKYCEIVVLRLSIPESVIRSSAAIASTNDRLVAPEP